MKKIINLILLLCLVSSCSTMRDTRKDDRNEWRKCVKDLVRSKLTPEEVFYTCGRYEE